MLSLTHCVCMPQKQSIKIIWFVTGNTQILTEGTLLGHWVLLGAKIRRPGLSGALVGWEEIQLESDIVPCPPPPPHCLHYLDFHLWGETPDIDGDGLEIWNGCGKRRRGTLLDVQENTSKCCERPRGDTTANGYFCFLPYSFLWQCLSSCLQEKLHTWKKPQLSGMMLAESIPKPFHLPITIPFTPLPHFTLNSHGFA